MLTHIFSPSVCAQCRLCCNFCQRSAWETPFLEPGMAEAMKQRHIPLTVRKNGSQTLALSYHTSDPEEICNCPLLNTQSGCSLLREERPFECRVWPIRLMYDECNHLCIACYKDCPALHSIDTWDSLVRFATGPLLPTLLDYAARFPQSIRPFDSHYTILWTQK